MVDWENAAKAVEKVLMMTVNDDDDDDDGIQELVLKVYFKTTLGIYTPRPEQIFPGSSKSGGSRQGCL